MPSPFMLTGNVRTSFTFRVIRWEDLLRDNLNRNYIFRADYGLYQYPVYVCK